MRFAPALAFGVFVTSSLPALAYTAADAKACMSDAFRLCAKAIPNHARVAACLNAKHDQLSVGCAEAVDRFTRSDTTQHARQKVTAD